MKNLKYIIIALVLSIGIVSYLFYSPPEDALAGVPAGAKDVVGSRVATTTTGAFFPESPILNGTTSVPFGNIGWQDLALLTFKITAASSTPNGILYWNVVGSNDASCTTATTTTTMAGVTVKSDINWFHLGQEGNITATGAVATGTVITLTNLNWNCLNVEINGSSTSAWVQLRTKDSL